jgi:hypothetical protein
MAEKIESGGMMMAIIERRKRAWACIGLIIAVLFIVTGCSGLKSGRKGGSAGTSGAKDKGASPLYYDFGDVLIPKELKVDKKSSFVYQTPGFSAGVLVLNGRVEINSLIAFFENNMTKDNWRPVSKFKSPRTIMLYQKENRWCIINITEKGYTTHTEIWVSPTFGDMDSGLLK